MIHDVDLVGAAEIAEMLDVTRQRVDQLARTDGFPAPVAELTAGRIWERADIFAWVAETGRRTSEHVRFLAQSIGPATCNKCGALIPEGFNNHDCNHPATQPPASEL